ncbi:hypothetical protein [Aquimarina sp. MMG016]|uniref:hypothetical protein n=1 Tax=Aquimarina sp. MMG016 TaxID=2822690 RepID=UPI001B3A17C0|nr:hypothetical protein [Aquimarina sp. MMG016]MBQ4818607.1 hypothetical protein [Aquimarina sp. MMG016]
MKTIEKLNDAIKEKMEEHGINKDTPIRVDSIPFERGSTQLEEGVYLDVELEDVYNPYTSEIEKIKIIVIKSKSQKYEEQKEKLGYKRTSISLKNKKSK